MSRTSSAIFLLSLQLWVVLVVSFAPTTTIRRHHHQRTLLSVLHSSTTASTDETTSNVDDNEDATTSTAAIEIDPKEAVKIFGRLAEKYIALDSSGGDCCYSACTDCEYRLPGGGYIMADQTAARPKWIPSYETRNSNNREHTTKWSSQLFCNAENDSTTVVTKDEFVQRLVALDYAPPLGGPYVGASSAAIQDTTAAERFFDILTQQQQQQQSNDNTQPTKNKLTKYKMSVRLKQLADGEEGLTWSAFQSAMMG